MWLSNFKKAIILKEFEILSQLIDEILFLSSLESGSAEDIGGKSGLRGISEKVIDKLDPLARQFNTTLDNQVPTDLVIPLSERMTSTVLTNLLENAIKYSGQGTNVVLKAFRQAGALRITVRDDGIGIDAEHLPHIFERFHRVDKSRSRSLGGTGLGLSIVKHVVESAGGSVSAKSREGFGAEITLVFPGP